MSENETPAQRRQRRIAELQARGNDEHLTTPPEVVEPEDDLDEDEDIDEVPRGPVIEDGWPERKLFLLSLITDPELRDEITDAELRAMDARISKKARDERRKAALESLEDELLHRARVDENLLNANTLRTMEEKARLAEMVRVRFTLPGDGAGHRGPNGFRVDGRIWENGQWNIMTVAEMESLRETHYLAHVAEIQFATLDQARKAGLGMYTRAQGTTAARVLMARSPATMEVEPLLV